MAAIQYDSVDATISLPASNVEESIALSLSNGAVLQQNYTVSIPQNTEDSYALSLSNGSVLQQNYTVSIPLLGEPSVSQGVSTKEFWG